MGYRNVSLQLEEFVRRIRTLTPLVLERHHGALIGCNRANGLDLCVAVEDEAFVCRPLQNILVLRLKLMSVWSDGPRMEVLHFARTVERYVQFAGVAPFGGQDLTYFTVIASRLSVLCDRDGVFA